VYGSVRTVVWQGSVGDCRPYADQTSYPDIEPAVLKRFQKRLRCQQANPLILHHSIAGLCVFQNDLVLESNAFYSCA
jgi:hypothetical protein